MIKSLVMSLGLLLLLSTAGLADALTLTVLNDGQSGASGSVLTYTLLLQNNDDVPVDLNSIQINLNGSFLVDDSLFYANAPFTLGANAFPYVPPPLAAFDTLTVTIDDGAAPGPAVGTITLLGGPEVNGAYDPTTLDSLGSASFTVIVNPEIATPEPATKVRNGSDAVGLITLRG